MLRVDWQRFGENIRAYAVADATHVTNAGQKLGISHARMVNAAQGKPVGVEIFLTLCHWMQQDPLWFSRPEATVEPVQDDAATKAGEAKC